MCVQIKNIQARPAVYKNIIIACSISSVKQELSHGAPQNANTSNIKLAWLQSLVESSMQFLAEANVKYFLPQDLKN